MSRRSDQRRAAVFALYQAELLGRELDDVFERDTALFTRALAHATADYQDGLDAVIERYSRGWALSRIAPLERSILRVALLEIMHPEVLDADVPIPPAGAIDEAVETAKEYCGAEAPGFINGLLGAALRAGEGGGAAAEEPAPDGPESDTPAPDGSGSDAPAADGSGSEDPAADGSGSEDPAADGSGSNVPAADGSGSDAPAADGSGSDAPAADGLDA